MSCVSNSAKRCALALHRLDLGNRSLAAEDITERRLKAMTLDGISRPYELASGK
jgi:hypothetical protein